jgi:hypothetical protein
MAEHPAGWLAWRHANDCSLRDSEDARHVADLELLGSSRRRVLRRPATPTEATLLGALGYTVPVDLATEVRSITASVIRRSWPRLEPATTTTDTGGTAA